MVTTNRISVSAP